MVNNVLINEQHGFRKGFSCTTKLVELFHELASKVDEGGQRNCAFLDFEKAFDTVSHSLLFAKLDSRFPPECAHFQDQLLVGHAWIRAFKWEVFILC